MGQLQDKNQNIIIAKQFQLIRAYIQLAKHAITSHAGCKNCRGREAKLQKVERRRRDGGRRRKWKSVATRPLKASRLFNPEDCQRTSKEPPRTRKNKTALHCAEQEEQDNLRGKKAY